MKKARASFTAEMAVIFPVVLAAIFLLMQLGIFYGFSVKTKAGCEEALSLYACERNRGSSLEKARQEAAEYLESTFSGSTERYAYTLDCQENFLSEQDILAVSVTCPLFVPLHYEIVQKREEMDPVTFRNRVDFLYEKVFKK